MKAAVYNRGLLSEKLIQKLHEHCDDIGIAGIFDIPGSKEHNSSDFGLDEVKEKILRGDIDALIVPDPDKRVNDVLPLLGDCKVPVYYAGLNMIRRECAPELKTVDYDREWLSILEYHVADNCNMNCKGCGHCANIIEEPGFPDISEYERSLKRLSELYDGVGLIRLLGGEPLLNPELPEFLRLSRKFFPQTNLHVATNGILLPEISEELKRILREECITIDISLYPPMYEREEDLIKELSRQDILFNIFKVDHFYRRFDPKGGNDADSSFAACESSRNHLMYRGKIAYCAMPFSVDVLSSRYGYKIEHDAWIDLFDEAADGRKINRRLATASSLCSYCRPYLEKYKWEQKGIGEAEALDWICRADGEESGEY